jgi:hypothetical protein
VWKGEVVDEHDLAEEIMDTADDKPNTIRRRSILTGDTLAWIGAGTMLVVLLLFVFVLDPAMNRHFDKVRETKRYVMYAQEAGRECPPIEPRMKELLSDGRVTQQEADVIGTLLDQAKAQPGGLKACRYER